MISEDEIRKRLALLDAKIDKTEEQIKIAQEMISTLKKLIDLCLKK